MAAFSGLREGGTPLRVAEYLEADGNWCNALQVQAMLPGTAPNTITRAIGRLDERGIVETRIVPNVDWPAPPVTEARFIAWHDPEDTPRRRNRMTLGAEIREALLEGPVTVPALAEGLGAKRRAITKQLRQMDNAGVVVYWPGRGNVDGLAFLV